MSYCKRTHHSLSKADIITRPQGTLNHKALHRRIIQTKRQVPSGLTVSSSNPPPSFEGQSAQYRRKASFPSPACRKELPKHTLNISSAVIHPSLDCRKNLQLKMQPKVIFSRRFTRPKTEMIDYSARSSLPFGVQSPSFSDYSRQRPFTAAPKIRDSVNRLRTIHVELPIQEKRERGASQFD